MIVLGDHNDCAVGFVSDDHVCLSLRTRTGEAAPAPILATGGQFAKVTFDITPIRSRRSRFAKIEPRPSPPEPERGRG
jgi:hypothetical protein